MTDQPKPTTGIDEATAAAAVATAAAEQLAQLNTLATKQEPTE